MEHRYPHPAKLDRERVAMIPLLLSAAALAIASHALEIGALSCALVVGLALGYWCGLRDEGRKRWHR